MGGKIGVLLELNCESDFVARTDDFQALMRELTLQVAAANPQYVRREEVPADVLDRERSVYRAQMENSGKAAPGHRQDHRGQARRVLRAGLSGRSAVDPRSEADREPDDPGGHRQARREHRRRALRAIQSRRVRSPKGPEP
jgi:hypothetical protein